MSEYIKKEDVENMLADADLIFDGEYLGYCRDDILIENIPAADVAEVKHGKWIKDEGGIVICSNCGEEHCWDEYRAPYCDQCGAKMDLEE